MRPQKDVKLKNTCSIQYRVQSLPNRKNWCAFLFDLPDVQAYGPQSSGQMKTSSGSYETEIEFSPPAIQQKRRNARVCIQVLVLGSISRKARTRSA